MVHREERRNMIEVVREIIPGVSDEAANTRLQQNWEQPIPTETLEAGEVVPLALVDSIIREVLTNEEKYVPAAMLGNQGLNAYHGIMREIRNALSRLQQNGGVDKR